MSEKAFERSATTQAAVDALAKLRHGQHVTYERLSAVMGVEARGSRGRAHLWSARRILLTEQQKVFGCIPSVGLRLLTPDDVVNHGSHRRKKIRNQSRYCLNEYDTIADQLSTLAAEARAEYMGNTVLMEALRQQAGYMAAQKRQRTILAQGEPPNLDIFKNS